MKSKFSLSIFKAVVVTAAYYALFALLSFTTSTIYNSIEFNWELSFQNLLWTYSLSNLLYVLIFASVVLLYLFRIGKVTFQLSTNWLTGDVLWGLLAIGLGHIIVGVQPYLFSNVNWDYSFTLLDGYRVPTFIKAVIVIPVLEELFFRKYLLQGVANKYNSLVGLFVSTALFSVVHLPGYQSMIIAFLGGIISGVLYIYSKRLSPSILFHITWNLLAFYG